MDMYHTKILKAIESEDYISVRRRVLRQLVESLIYEGIITPARIEKKNKFFFLYKDLMRTIKVSRTNVTEENE